MADPVETAALLDDTRAFLAELRDNNTRDWFNRHKARYDSRLKRPAERLMADLAQVLETRYGRPVKPKLFRAHRDVRFTDDKTPYHVHLHMMWSLPDTRAWFFGIALDYASFGAGIMQFSPDQLTRWREAVAGAPGEDLTALLETGGWRMAEPDLKRVPAPFEADHPRAALLRRKGLAVWIDGLESALRSDPLAALQSGVETLDPVMHWLKTHL